MVIRVLPENWLLNNGLSIIGYLTYYLLPLHKYGEGKVVAKLRQGEVKKNGIFYLNIREKN